MIDSLKHGATNAFVTPLSFDYPDPSGTSASIYAGNPWADLAMKSVSSSILSHKSLVARTLETPERWEPIVLVRFRSRAPTSPESSSSNVASALSEYYQALEHQLALLSDESSGEALPVERGAVTTAQTVLQKLKTFQHPPPALSWHGGDAIMMLWSMEKTTYAMTITDGEVGYVVRRDKKTIDKRYSIPVTSLRLIDHNADTY